MQNLSMQPCKVEARIEIPIYNETIDAKRLDNWLDQLEIYFTIYGYSNIKKITFTYLKLSSYMLLSGEIHT